MEEILIDFHIKKLIHTSNGNETLELKASIPRFGFVTIFGKSGVGKTSLLRMLAGLSKPDSGFIKVNDQIWFDGSKKINLNPQQRNIGFVFQDYALFPNMTVKEHLLYAQFYKEKEYVSELLDIFHLKGLCERKPAKLSGGQQQRLAVARALARKPEILLFDEPLSALDNETRTNLQHEILQAHKKFSATTLLVSHDINEIVRLSDYVYIIENGAFSRQGNPNTIFENTGSGKKFQIEAQVLKIENTAVTISVNNTINVIDVSEVEARNLKIDEIIKLTVDAHNPVISKISTTNSG